MAFKSAASLARESSELQPIEVEEPVEIEVAADEFSGTSVSIVPVQEAIWNRLRHPDDAPRLMALFQAVEPVLADLYPMVSQDSFRGVTEVRELPGAFGTVLSTAASALSLQQPRVFQRHVPTGRLDPMPSLPPALIVSPDVLNSQALPELAFRIGRALVLLRPGYRVCAGQPMEILADAVLAVVGTMYPQIPLPDVQGRVGKIRRGLEARPDLMRLIKSSLATLSNPLEPLVLEKWQRGIDATADRVGLLFGGDLGVASRVLSGSGLDRLPDLMAFAESEDYDDLLRSIEQQDDRRLRRVTVSQTLG
jgi:hypothetical protein